MVIPKELLEFFVNFIFLGNQSFNICHRFFNFQLRFTYLGTDKATC